MGILDDEFDWAECLHAIAESYREEGREAAMAGTGLDDCPYCPQSQALAAAAWEDGFLQRWHEIYLHEAEDDC